MTAAVVSIRPHDPLADILRLIDLEDEGEAAAQAHSMRAARALFDLKENTDRWVPEMEARKAAEEAKTDRAVPWLPSSKETFYRWLGEKLKESDHRSLRRTEMQNLLNAEGMRRVVTKAATNVAIPQTEGAWRPATPLYKSGYHKQLVSAVLLAGEIAEREGTAITNEIMRSAKWEVWKSDPQIKTRGAHPDQATERDRAIKARHEAERWVKELWKAGQDVEIDAFLTWFDGWRAKP